MEKVLSKPDCKKISLESDFFLEGQEAEMLRSEIFKKQPDDEDLEDIEAEKTPM
jgi:hypothetical protein